ncbi:FecR family protein [Spirosoma areae]
MKTSIPKSVLFDFFEGKATSIQRKLIEEWLEVPQNEPLFYQCLDEWESQHPQYLPNTGQALSRYLDQLKTPPVAVVAEPEKPVSTLVVSRSWFSQWYMAASVVMLLGAGLFFFRKPLRYQTYHTGNAQTQAVRLADGTQVTLNANSTLYVPRWGFNSAKRVVILDGEGEFNVTHMADNKRFTVQTETDFEVEVLGTEFVLYARERGKKVVLNKGKVQINYQAGKQLTLKPGDVATLNQRSGRMHLAQTAKPQLHSSWKNHQFYFDQTPLSEVADVLHDHFGVDVVIEDSTQANRRLAGYFKAKNPQEIIDVLSTLLNLPIEQRGNQVIIHAAQ